MLNKAHRLLQHQPGSAPAEVLRSFQLQGHVGSKISVDVYEQAVRLTGRMQTAADAVAASRAHTGERAGAEQGGAAALLGRGEGR